MVKKDFIGEMCIHNPLDLRYKSLIGAVSNTAPVVFCVDIRKDCVDTEGDVYFVMRHIDGNNINKIKMSLAEELDCLLRFTLTANFNEIGIFLYHFETAGKDGIKYIGINADKQAEFQDFLVGWQLSVFESSDAAPEWSKGGIMYHIFVDRFHSSAKYAPVIKDKTILRMDWGNMPEYLPDSKGEVLNNDFFGGNLQGIIEKLPYLKSLNVSIIYLSPIFEAYSSHKYDTSDYSKIDGMFGGESDFKELCERAREVGISVILDGVFNHTGSDSVYFSGENGAARTKDSPYFDWYDFQRWPDLYKCWWGFKTLPSLNADSEALYGFFNGAEGVAARWLDAGARGWRLDVVDEINDKMLEGIVNASKTARPDALIIGEVWEDASNKIAYGKRRRYFLGGQLDSVTNYPLRDAIIEFIREGNKDRLSKTVFDLCNNYPKTVLDNLMNIIGTHDTERILTALNGENLKHSSREVKARARMSFDELILAKKYLVLASVLQYTLPGLPCVYYGDEAGMQGYNDPFNRRCYPWGNEDKSLVSHYRLLGEIRSKFDIFKDGYYREISSPCGVYTFERFRGDGSDSGIPFKSTEKITVIVNRSDKPYIFRAGTSTELLTGSKVDSGLTIEPLSAAILLCRKEKQYRITPPLQTKPQSE